MSTGSERPLHAIPDSRHPVVAIEDSVILLTVALG
jgi:hypothetical protein